MRDICFNHHLPISLLDKPIVVVCFVTGQQSSFLLFNKCSCFKCQSSHRIATNGNRVD